MWTCIYWQGLLIKNLHWRYIPFHRQKFLTFRIKLNLPKRDFHPFLHIMQIGTNDISWEDTTEQKSKRAVKSFESLKKKNVLATSNIIPHTDNLKEKGKTLCTEKWMTPSLKHIFIKVDFSSFPMVSGSALYKVS